MRLIKSLFIVVLGFPVISMAQKNAPASQPDHSSTKEWIDADTGHRIVRLSDEPGSISMYFHQNPFSTDGKKLMFTSRTGLYQVDLETRKIEQIMPGNTAQFTQGNTGPGNNVIVRGRKTGRIYFTKTEQAADGSLTRSIWWIDPETKEQHKVGALPTGVAMGTLNADETLLAGAITKAQPTTQIVGAANSGGNLNTRWNEHLPMELCTMNTSTGEIKYFNPSNDWDNHFQFSPADPNMLMFCHEGPWQNNDRVWAIHADGTDLFKVHERTMMNETWGHEFWSADGKMIWYQLSTPAGRNGAQWLAGYNLETKQQTWLQDAPSTGSIHVNVSKDGSMFAGDGNAQNPWVFLFHPVYARNMAAGIYDASKLIQPGYLTSEKLVNMKDHQYGLEPNPVFTPDMKWVVFRSNMLGATYVFMVEVAKAG